MTEDEMVGWHHQLSGNAAAAIKSLQSCLTLCDPIVSRPPAPLSLGFSGRVLEWVAIFFSISGHEFG